MKPVRILFVSLLFISFNSLYSQNLFSVNNFDSLFNGYSATFLIKDLSSKSTFCYNTQLADEKDSPCSTFKILNSLIALETKVISDEEQILTWDGIKRDREVLNKDHNLKSAFSNSVVWFYQEVARKVGMDTMRKYVKACQYGNMNISGGIDKFWLVNSLLISPKEQLNFLEKFYKEELPFSKRNLSIVKNIMIRISGNNFILHGKTGSGEIDVKKNVGWFIGYLEIDQKIYLFVTKIKGEKAGGLTAKDITYQILSNFFSTKIEE